MTKTFFPQTIPDKIFGTKQSSLVKLDRTCRSISNAALNVKATQNKGEV